MEAKAQQNPKFAIPIELNEAHLLDSGLSFIDIRLAPYHVVQSYLTLQHLKTVAENAQSKAK